MTLTKCAILGIVIAGAASAAFAAQVRPVRGPVILARSGATSTYLWDASPYVAQLVSEKNLGDVAMRALEGTAVSVLREKAKSSHSKMLLLRIVYTRSGAVSPAYGTLTFNGVEKLATVTAARDAILKKGSAWPQNVTDGKIPRELKLEITGNLPPQQ